MWRILLHERNTATRHEIETLWCYDDVIEAHQMLDIHDDLVSEAASRARAEANAKSKRKR